MFSSRCALRRWLTVASLAIACGLLAALASQTAANDWPGYRGSDRHGVSQETGWVASFDGGPSIAWRTNVGIGASSMAVVGNRVITMGNIDDRDVVVCLDADTGKSIWKHSYPNRFSSRQFDGGTATTPTIDGERVYVLSDRGDLFCLKLDDGSVVWQVDVVDAYDGSLPRWHYAGSPLVDGELLIVNIGGPRNSTLALNKDTGRKVWGVGDYKVGYGSPYAFSLNDKRYVVVPKAKSYLIHDIRTGREVAEIDWRISYDVNSGTPTVVNDTILLTGGYRGGRTALYRLVGDQPRIIWRNPDMAAKYSSPVVVDGHAYGVSGERRGDGGSGLVTCINMKTGRTMWQQGGFGNGTLIAADDKLIILSESGQLVIAQANPQGFVQLARARVIKGRTWVSPVLANGRIYCRNNEGDLVCIDVRPPKE